MHVGGWYRIHVGGWYRVHAGGWYGIHVGGWCGIHVGGWCGIHVSGWCGIHVSGWCGVQVRGQLEVVRSASREVQGSQDFTSLLQAVLALGNHLNEGTHKGNASGALLYPTPPTSTPPQTICPTRFALPTRA